MEELKFTVRMLAAYMKMSIEEMAKGAGLGEAHLKSVSSGRATMTAEDIMKLSLFTGIPAEKIQY